MARIRTIKPEFWRSPDIMQLDHFQRLLYIGLWNLADDEGRGTCDHASIAADLFLTEFSLNPHGTITAVSNAFNEYSIRGMVTVYEVGNRQYFQINNWKDHQRINRPSRSKFPAPTRVKAEITEPSLSTHGGLTPGTGNREQGSGTGNRDKDMSDSDESNVPVSSPKPKASKRHDYSPEFTEFWETYPIARGASKFETSKKFDNALKFADATTIIEAARRFAGDPNRTDEYTPMPTTWLNSRRWEAGPLPARSKPVVAADKNSREAWGLPPEPSSFGEVPPTTFPFGDYINHEEIS